MQKTVVSILIVDDEESVQRSFAVLFEENQSIFTAYDGREAMRIINEETIDLVFLDIDLPGKNGFEVLKDIKAFDPDIEVVMITADRNTKSAVQAMKLGASDYITKPFDIDEILLTVDRIAQEKQKEKELAYLKDQMRAANAPASMVGTSKAMHDIFRMVDRIAHSDSTVLITGESGTGKELIARQIHQVSVGDTEPFIAVNCGAIPDNLLESELFGHEKGAFTGAAEKKIGKFELARAGTIFLDEISTMPERLQAKLLRVLQEREFERVGGTRVIKMQARVVTATNMDLKAMIRKKEFREDLYHRINVIRIDVPPLRDRKEDIPLLVNHFMKQYADKFRSSVTTINPDVLHVMQEYPWPGNVRELSNILERLVLLTDGTTIKYDHLPMELIVQSHVYTKKSTGKKGFSFKQERADFERDIIIDTLKRVRFNQVKTARLLGIHRNTLLMKLKQYNIDVHELKRQSREAAKAAESV